MNRKDFILEQLFRIYQNVKRNDKKALICCPWHEENKPSLSIALSNNKVPVGTFRCFGCKKSGNWNKLAIKLGLKILGKDAHIKSDNDFAVLYQSFQNKIAINVEKKNIYKLPEELYEWKGSWRGLTESFLKQFQPAKYYCPSWKEWRIFFPIISFNKLVGHLHERIGRSRSPKHLFSLNFPANKILYPVDLHTGKTVILVEGLADMLRCRRDGLPALMFFGTGNWTSDKKNILIALGIEKVIAFGDGDVAGWDINRKIYKDLNKYFDVRVVDLPKKSIEIEGFNRELLIKYIENNGLPNILKKLNDEELFTRTSAYIDKKNKYDPGNCPVKYISHLIKKCGIIRWGTRGHS